MASLWRWLLLNLIIVFRTKRSDRKIQERVIWRYCLALHKFNKPNGMQAFKIGFSLLTLLTKFGKECDFSLGIFSILVVTFGIVTGKMF